MCFRSWLRSLRMHRRGRGGRFMIGWMIRGRRTRRGFRTRAVTLIEMLPGLGPRLVAGIVVFAVGGPLARSRPRQPPGHRFRRWVGVWLLLLRIGVGDPLRRRIARGLLSLSNSRSGSWGRKHLDRAMALSRIMRTAAMANDHQRTPARNSRRSGGWIRDASDISSRRARRFDRTRDIQSTIRTRCSGLTAAAKVRPVKNQRRNRLARRS
jgi:hypothetical protein